MPSWCCKKKKKKKPKPVHSANITRRAETCQSLTQGEPSLATATGAQAMDIEKVNSMDFGEFVDVFGNVIERCPLIAAAVWSKRPFSGLGDLEKHFFAFIDGLPLSGKALGWMLTEGFQVCLSKR